MEAAKIGEVSEIDAKHICTILENQRKIQIKENEEAEQKFFDECMEDENYLPF